MTVKKKSSQTIELEAAAVEENTASFSTDNEEVAAEFCPQCGELLAWHEEECATVSEKPLPAEEKSIPMVVDESAPNLAPKPYAFAVGQTVQPEPAAQVRTIIWRGQVKARHPSLGLVYRLNVYQLNNGHWDCYYESELQAA